MKKNIITLTVGLALVLGLSGPTFATILEHKSFEDLVAQADLVAIGRVLNVESHPTVDNQYAYTYTTVGELEILKGTYRQPIITLRMDGGDAGNRKTLVVAGVPRFQTGEKVAVFVRGNGRSICPLVGWEQGALRIVRDPRTGQETLRTSDGRKIRQIEKGEFVTDSADHNEADSSAGAPDYGHVQTLARTNERANQLLTLDTLRLQVRSTLAKAGLKALPKEEVTSAEITLDPPALRSSKTPRRY